MTGTEVTIPLYIIAFILLAIGSWQDIKEREIADWIWLSMIGSGLILHLIQLSILFLAGESIIEYLTTLIINIASGFIIALILTFSGLGGEADRIAFIAIAVITPIALPLFIIQDFQYIFLAKFTPRVIGTFCNAYLIAIPIPVLIFVFNLINQIFHPELYLSINDPLWKRVVVRFIGYPRHTQQLDMDLQKKPWHYDFLEEYDQNSGWRIVFRSSLDSPEADFSRKEELISIIQSKDKYSVWIQPSLPFIFILFLGYLLDVIMGNILFILMSVIF